MVEDLADALANLSEDVRDILAEEAGEDLDVLREWLPELQDLCQHVWLMELVIKLCKGG